MGQYSVNDHPYHAHQFNTVILSAKTNYFFLNLRKCKIFELCKNDDVIQLCVWFICLNSSLSSRLHNAWADIFSNFIVGLIFDTESRDHNVSFEIRKYFFSGINALSVGSKTG